MKRLLLAAALSLLASTSAAAQTVFLVRHAEKADQSADPDLSAVGQARAEALAGRFADLRPDYILVTPLKRTAQTAAPTALTYAVTPEPISLDGGAQIHADRVAARVRELPQDAVVLIVGHSNTIPLIARGLGYAEAADMPECEYDRLTRLNLEGGSVMAVVTTYGERAICP